MPKRPRVEAPPDLEKLLQYVLCYYCNRSFSDNKFLQDHMKKQHLFCTHCNKKMDSMGGLKVHCESVHKMPLASLPNAIEGRDDVGPTAPEIYLMEGVPHQIAEDFYRGIREEHAKLTHEYRMATGHYPPGSREAAEHALKKVKVEEETPEQKKARRDAYIAKKRAEKAARETAIQNGGATVKEEPKDDFASQEEHVAPQPNQKFLNTGPGMPQNNNYLPGYAASPPIGASELGPSQQGYGYGAGPQYGYSPTNYGQPTPFQPSYPPPPFPPQQPIAFGGSPQGFPQQPIAPYPSHSPPSHTFPVVKIEPGVDMNGKSSITAAPPGLPQRPTFDTPSFSKHDMARFHHGHSAPHSQQVAGSSDADRSRATEPTSADTSTIDQAFDQSRRDLEASIDELISTGKEQAEASNRDAEAEEAQAAATAAYSTSAMTASAPATLATSAAATTLSAPRTIFKYGHNHFMPEENLSDSSTYEEGASKPQREPFISAHRSRLDWMSDEEKAVTGVPTMNWPS